MAFQKWFYKSITFAFIIVLQLLSLHLSIIFSQSDCEFQTLADSKYYYKASWVLNRDLTSVSFVIDSEGHYATMNWAAIGFVYGNNASMINADVIIGWNIGKNPHISDYYSYARAIPIDDVTINGKNNLQRTAVKLANVNNRPILQLKFDRLIDTKDPYDVPLIRDNECPYFLFPAGGGRVVYLNGYGNAYPYYHIQTPIGKKICIHGCIQIPGYSRQIGGCEKTFTGIIRTITTGDAFECARQCEAESKCRGVEYDFRIKQCNILSAECRVEGKNDFVKVFSKGEWPEIPGYERYESDCPGSNLDDNYRKCCNTVASCAAECSRVGGDGTSIDSCAGFSFIRETRECWLKRHYCIPTGAVNNDVKFYKRMDIVTPQPPFPNITGYYRYEGDCASGLNAKTCRDSTCDTAFECAELCNRDTNCKGFSFKFDSSLCFLKNLTCGLNPPTPDANTRFYLKGKQSPDKTWPAIPGFTLYGGPCLNHASYQECRAPFCTSEQECSSQCNLQLDKCKGFTFDFVSGTCSLHDTECSSHKISFSTTPNNRNMRYYRKWGECIVKGKKGYELIWTYDPNVQPEVLNFKIKGNVTSPSNTRWTGVGFSLSQDINSAELVYGSAALVGSGVVINRVASERQPLQPSNIQQQTVVQVDDMVQLDFQRNRESLPNTRGINIGRYPSVDPGTYFVLPSDGGDIFDQSQFMHSKQLEIAGPFWADSCRALKSCRFPVVPRYSVLNGYCRNRGQSLPCLADRCHSPQSCAAQCNSNDQCDGFEWDCETLKCVLRSYQNRYDDYCFGPIDQAEENKVKFYRKIQPGVYSRGRDYRLWWACDQENGQLLVKMNATKATPNGQPAWTGIGFSVDKNLEKSDFIIGWLAGNGSGVVEDRWLENDFSTTRDAVQNLTDTSYSTGRYIASMSFTKPLITGDPEDIMLNQDIYFIIFDNPGHIYPGSQPAAPINGFSKPATVGPVEPCSAFTIKTCKWRIAGGYTMLNGYCNDKPSLVCTTCNSLESCVSECSRNLNCKGFEFNCETDTCELKSADCLAPNRLDSPIPKKKFYRKYGPCEWQSEVTQYKAIMTLDPDEKNIRFKITADLKKSANEFLWTGVGISKVKPGRDTLRDVMLAYFNGDTGIVEDRYKTSQYSQIELDKRLQNVQLVRAKKNNSSQHFEFTRPLASTDTTEDVGVTMSGSNCAYFEFPQKGGQIWMTGSQPYLYDAEGTPQIDGLYVVGPLCVESCRAPTCNPCHAFNNYECKESVCNDGNSLGFCSACDTVVSCRDACDRNKKCTGFNWNCLDRKCELRISPSCKPTSDEIYSPKQSSVNVIGYFHKIVKPKTHFPLGYHCSAGICLGQQMGNCDTCTTLELCANNCAATRGCQSFSMNLGPIKQCILRNAFCESPVAQVDVYTCNRLLCQKNTYGKEYVVMSLKNDLIENDGSKTVLAISTDSIDDVEVNVTSDGTSKRYFVSKGNQQALPVEIKHQDNNRDTVQVKANDRVSLLVNSDKSESFGMYSAIPVSSLGKEYYAACLRPATKACVIGISAIYENTFVEITLPPQPTSGLTCSIVAAGMGSTYSMTNGGKYTFIIGREKGLHLADPCDLTGTRIVANNTIAVVSGNMQVRTENVLTHDHIVEQMLPIEAYDTRFYSTLVPREGEFDVYFIILSLSNTTSVLFTDGLILNKRHLLEKNFLQLGPFDGRIVYTFSATGPVAIIQVVGGQKLIGSFGDAAMINLVGELKWDNIYFVPLGPTFSAIAIDSKKSSGLRANGVPLQYIRNWRPIPGTSLIQNIVPTNNDTVFSHTDPDARFVVYMFLTIQKSAAATFSGQCIDNTRDCVKSVQLVDDGIDNDCDGKVDEEYCDGLDDDSDGEVDEDCKTLPKEEIPFCTQKNNDGLEFYFTFLPNGDGSDTPVNEIYITTNYDEEQIQIAIDGPTTANQNKKIDNTRSYSLTIPTPVLLGSVKQKNAIRLKSSGQPIQVIGMSSTGDSGGSFLILPTSVLGLTYYVVTYAPATVAAQFAIVATKGNTNVNVIFASSPGTDLRVDYNGQEYRRGSELKEVLGQYEVLQIQTKFGDLTGTRITADAPIAVYSGNAKTVISPSVIEDHMVSAIPPVSTWGKTFVVIPLPERSLDVIDIIRVVASSDETTVKMGQSPTKTLQSAGDFVDLQVDIDLCKYIEANKPILVVYISKGRTSSSVSGKAAPSMMVIPPLEQWRDKYTFSLPTSSFNQATKNFVNYILLATKKSVKGKIHLKSGVQVTPQLPGWMEIENSDLQCAIVSDVKSDGVITLRSGAEDFSPFGAFVYGISTTEQSYANPAGLELKNLKDSCQKCKQVYPCDNIDNDCDGRVEEEKCDGIDNDGDGKIDEDCCSPQTVIKRETKVARACFSQTIDLSCNVDETIFIISAHFGRIGHVGDSKCGENPIDCMNIEIQCGYDNMYNSFAANCQGRQKCVMALNSYTLGSSARDGYCKSINKYAEVHYACLVRKAEGDQCISRPALKPWSYYSSCDTTTQLATSSCQKIERRNPLLCGVNGCPNTVTQWGSITQICAARHAVLSSSCNQAWCPSQTCDVTSAYLEIDTGAPYRITGYFIQGRRRWEHFVTKVGLAYSVDKIDWTEIKENGKLKEFPGNSDARELSWYQLGSNAFIARWIRVYILDYTGYPAMHFEITHCSKVVGCPPLQIPNSNMNDVSALLKQRVEIRCNPSFTTPQGDNSYITQCKEDGTWSKLRQCSKAVDCGDIPYVRNALHNGRSTSPGSAVTYRCRSGYTLQGSGTITCSSDGKWETPPTCQ